MAWNAPPVTPAGFSFSGAGRQHRGIALRGQWYGDRRIQSVSVSVSGRGLVHKTICRWPTPIAAISTGVSFLNAATTSVGFISGSAHTAASAYLIRESPTAYHFSSNAPFWLVTFTKCA